MDRRSFLTGASTLALSQTLAGCSGWGKETLSLHLLKNSIPAQLISQVRQALGNSLALDLNPESQLADLFSQLQTSKNKPDTASKRWLPDFLRFNQEQDRLAARQVLFSLGNSWLAAAIQQNLIQPLESDQLAHWANLPAPWQAFVTRDRQGTLTPQGQIWAAPYRWGTTAIAYRKDKFENLGWLPSSWDDLWRPQLQRRISLLDQPREVIGLTLKKLGKSYNTQNIKAVPNLETELRSLHQQTKLYSSQAYLQPLLLGDTWLAVGWSTDILPIVRRNNQIGAVVPQAGTALWADLWVRPTGVTASSQAASNQWIDFWWQPEIAAQLSQLSSGGSPLLTGSKLEQFHNRLLPNQQVFSRCEFIQPLSKAAIEQYRSLWLAIRQVS